MYVSLGCPTNLSVSPSPSSELDVNTILKCSSKDAPSSTTYYWLNGMVTVSAPGPFFLTCVAKSAIDGVHCVKTLNVSGAATAGLLNGVNINQSVNQSINVFMSGANL